MRVVTLVTAESSSLEIVVIKSLMEGKIVREILFTIELFGKLSIDNTMIH